VAPNELSYADSRAIKDIYMNRPGHLPFERNRTSFKKMSPDEPNSIVGFDEHDHARYRRAFANAFSEKALKDQAPVIERHVSDFTSQLRSLSSSKEQKESVIDFEKWFNYLTFDISGEFTFGESFNCVKSGAPHFWVQVTQDFGKGLAMIGTINHYPPFDKLLRYVIPKRILERSFTHRKLTMEKAKQRLAQSNPSANDWVTPTKKFSDAKDPFTEAEWGINLLVIAFAASETTASALCVILRSLLQNKGVLHRLTREIRTSFPSESDITIATTSNLSYLNAVINEGMRLGPPVVIGIPRVVPEGGDTVCGAWVPGGVRFPPSSLYPVSNPLLN
jgi:cytochrome P450